MTNPLGDLHPSRAVARRLHDLEAELARAQAYRRQHAKSPDTVGRWGLDQPPAPEQEEGWFMTYLDMMTLLLVVMIVMLAFSGMPGNRKAADTSLAASTTETAVTAAMPAKPDNTAATAVTASTVASPTIAANDTPPRNASHPTEQPSRDADLPGGTGLLPGGTGLLPGGNGLLAGDGVLPASSLGVESLPHGASSQADMSASSSAKASGMPEREVPWLSGPRLSDMYPGYAATDLTASFVGPPKPGMLTDGNASTPVAPAAPRLSEGQLLASQMALKDLGAEVEILVNEGSVSFRVNSEILFDSSQADLSTSGLGVLRRIAAVLADSEHDVTVEGHTDSVPVRRNVRYPSNWELSSARAGSVVRYLQSNGVARQRLKAVGYADTRAIADNNTPDGRARNRRVELVIEKRE